jgi:hypothetical protein
MRERHHQRGGVGVQQAGVGQQADSRLLGSFDHCSVLGQRVTDVVAGDQQNPVGAVESVA